MAAKLLLVCVLALATVAAGRRTSDKMFDARSWLSAHSQGKDAPDMDDLKELQQTNPDAYALVKALLVKQSLGLIRRKAPADSETETVVDDGSGHGAKVERNFFNWKPPSDGAAVTAVLGDAGANMDAAQVDEAPAPVPEQAPPAPAVTKPEASTTSDDVFSKGASEAATPAATSPKKDGGGKDGAFWSGLFDGKPQQHEQPKQEETAAAPANPVEEAVEAPPKKKKVAAISASSGTSALSSFDWNLDDGDDDKKAAAPAKAGSLPADNSYAHFLD